MVVSEEDRSSNCPGPCGLRSAEEYRGSHPEMDSHTGSEIWFSSGFWTSCPGLDASRVVSHPDSTIANRDSEPRREPGQRPGIANRDSEPQYLDANCSNAPTRTATSDFRLLVSSALRVFDPLPLLPALEGEVQQRGGRVQRGL
jgi:hypothetical protein